MASPWSMRVFCSRLMELWRTSIFVFEQQDRKLNTVIDWCDQLAWHLSAPLLTPIIGAWPKMPFHLPQGTDKDGKEEEAKDPTA